MLKKIKENPFSIVIWLGMMVAIHFLLFIAKIDKDISLLMRIVSLFVAIIVILIGHEVIHYIFMRVFGGKNAKIEFAKDPIGIPGLRAIAYGEFERWQLVIIFMAPFCLLTLLLDIILAFTGKIMLGLFIIAVGNSVGCFFDIIDTLLLFQKDSK